MTQEEQRLAIAKWAGWSVGEMGWWSHPTLPDNGGAEPDPPDYPNDLNAMEAAEAALVGHEMIRYQAILHEICPHNPHVASWHLIHASAAQRCEALCRTLFPEKW